MLVLVVDAIGEENIAFYTLFLSIMFRWLVIQAGQPSILRRVDGSCHKVQTPSNIRMVISKHHDLFVLEKPRFKIGSKRFSGKHSTYNEAERLIPAAFHRNAIHRKHLKPENTDVSQLNPSS